MTWRNRRSRLRRLIATSFKTSSTLMGSDACWRMNLAASAMISSSMLSTSVEWRVMTPWGAISMGCAGAFLLSSGCRAVLAASKPICSAPRSMLESVGRAISFSRTSLSTPRTAISSGTEIPFWRQISMACQAYRSLAARIAQGAAGI